jgi:hypothetical protein
VLAARPADYRGTDVGIGPLRDPPQGQPAGMTFGTGTRASTPSALAQLRGWEESI